MHELDIKDNPPWSQPRPKWPRRLLLGGLVVVAFGLAVAFIYFVVSCDQALQDAIAEADSLDPGWSVPELELKRAVIPDEANSGLVLIAAKSIMPPNWPVWDNPRAPERGERSEDEMRSLQEGLSGLEPYVRLDELQTKSLREELRRANKALAAARKVADLPRGRYSINYTKDFVGTLLPYTQDARSLGNLLAYDALLRAQDEDADGALTSCRGILNCGRSIGDEPTLVSMLIRIALNHLATTKVERTLAQGVPSEAALSRIQREFEAEAKQPLLLIGARGERGILDGLMQAIQAGEVNPTYFNWVVAADSSGSGRSSLVQLLWVPGVAKSLRAALLKYNNQFVEIAKLPVEEQVGRIKELQAAANDLPDLARPISLASTNVSPAYHRDQAELRCAAVMVAVERYRRANQHWPAALTDLVPAYLSQVPLDPFDGGPLRYRGLQEGVVIYSVGPDGEDNGGKLSAGRTREGTDVGYRLWDVPQRRQPKPPL